MESLPTFTLAEVESHNSAKSCYVTIGRRVYDVTDFLDAHPGGGDLILDYAGRDILDILKDVESHEHTDNAYEILDESLVGYLESSPVANGNGHANGNGKSTTTNGNGNADTNGKWVHPRTGMSCEEDLSRETNASDDFKTHKFLDLERPLLMQVWNGGFTKKFYLDQVHRPRHYKGGKSAPIFGNFLEPLSLTPWWVVPMLWVPAVSYGIWLAAQGLPPLVTAVFVGFGLSLWSFIEYCLHRFLFHLDDYLPDHRAALTLHFLLHGVHHYLPMDKYRLVLPPTLLIVLGFPFWKLAHFLFAHNWYVGTAVFCGGIIGYIGYDLTHYFLHHRNLPSFYKDLKKHHLEHHFLDYELGFGVSTRFWDRVFGTELVRTSKNTSKLK